MTHPLHDSNTMCCLFLTVGPNNVRISGPKLAETGDTVMFNCSASSWPSSHFSWYFTNDSTQMLELVANGSSYTTKPLTLESRGNYTCMAYNNVTGLNSSASMELAVLGENGFWYSEDFSRPMLFPHKVSLFKCCVSAFVLIEMHRFD